MKSKFRKIAICISIILALLLSSCGSQNSSNLLTKNYKTGYNGLTITTLENYPPTTVYPSSNFGMVIKLDNQGAYQLSNGKVEIVGFDNKYMILDQYLQEIRSLSGNNYLEGKSHTNPKGEFSYLEFKATSKKLFNGSQMYHAPYFIKAEYDYQNELTHTVCINPNLYAVNDAGCKVTFQKSFSGQGSPVAITDMEEVIHPGSIPQAEFRFKIKNNGRGKVKKINLKTAKLGKDNLICEFRNNPGKNKKEITFKNKQETTLICKKAISSGKSYYTTLYIDFSFHYNLEEQKRIMIKDEP